MGITGDQESWRSPARWRVGFRHIRIGMLVPMSSSSSLATLRPAILADVPIILGFIRELAAYEKLEHQVVATEALLAEQLFGPRPAAEVVIAELNGAAVGFALFFNNFSTFLGRKGLFLEDLYVQPHARGSGIGKALLRHLARMAVARGCGRMDWNVLDWNAPAIGFYEKLGADVLPDWRTCRLTGDALKALARG
jgi:GNAT superfamily N-acetyltransferase